MLRRFTSLMKKQRDKNDDKCHICSILGFREVLFLIRRRGGLVVKTLNSSLKGTGFESYQDHLCFFLEQENLLQLLHSTQVRMGTWPFGSFVLSKTKKNVK